MGRLAGIGIHSARLQAVYEATNDPAIWDRIQQAGAQADCRASYAQSTVEPRALGERWEPQGSICKSAAQRQRGM